ncbi:MAG: hypothetical protein ABJC39_01840 [Chloroflexota bacterium]
MRRLLVLVAFSLVACGVPAPTASPAGKHETTQVVDVVGPFQLTFALPLTTLASGDAIEGEAQLALMAGNQAKVFGSGGGLLAFEFQQIGGGRHIEPVWTADCAPHTLATNQPMRSAITKSGGWSNDQQDAQFYRDFFADPVVRLPIGEWDITAVAMFVEGEGCGGASHTLRASIRVRITN